MSGATRHLSQQELIDYWLRDSDPAATDAADVHLMACEACGAALDELIALGQGVRDAFRVGRVAAVVSSAFVDRLRGRGLRIREYRLPHNGSVRCTVAPDDELLVARIDVPLAGVDRVDAVATLSFLPGFEQRLEDIPFDPASGQVIYLPKLADIRRQPQHVMTLSLRARESGGERELGRYSFHHSPWAEG